MNEETKWTQSDHEKFCDNLKQKCDSCGYYGKFIGRIMVECCSRCDVEHDIGECRVCSGTGYVVNPNESNLPVIRALAKATNGYLCGGR